MKAYSIKSLAQLAIDIALVISTKLKEDWREAQNNRVSFNKNFNSDPQPYPVKLLEKEQLKSVEISLKEKKEISEKEMKFFRRLYSTSILELDKIKEKDKS